MLIPAIVLLACGGAPTPMDTDGDGIVSPQEQAKAERGPEKQKEYVEGRDYMVLQRLRVIDPSGFAQPMEAYSILVPKGWKSQGGITWQVGHPCMTEVIRNRVTATSPDGRFELNIYPAQQWDWWDDPMMLQAMYQNAQNPLTRRCAIAQPMDAGQFLQGPLALEMGAEVTKVEPAEELTRVMMQQAAANNQAMREAGVQIEYRPSAALGELRYPDGSAGVALTSLTVQVSWMPNYMTGGQSASYSSTCLQKVALKCPAGQEAQARKLLSTIMSSFRMNPEWQAGVSQMVRNVAAMDQIEARKRARIQQETDAYISDLRQRTWEESQASRDRTAETWGQLLRGVETWKDDQGGRIELNAGYNEAWSRPDGSYILSNDPLFDPNVVLQQEWKRLEKQR
jgi:hypothetical protein